MTEQKNKNSNIQMAIIIGLLLIIAIMGFFLGKNFAEQNSNTTEVVSTETKGDYEDLSITVIDDVRCGEKCPTDAIVTQLKQLPSVSNAKIITKDFADEGVKEYLKENNVKALPLIVFSTNNFDVSMDPVQMDQNGQPAPKVNAFLQVLPGGEYTLAIGATFNPFEERSDRGFLMLDKEKLQAVKDNSYIKGNKDAKITWIEYSDLECPYCAKLHNAGTSEDLEKKYGDNLNLVFNHFPLGFHANAQPGAEILECLGEQKGSEAFYDLIKKSYTDKNSTKSYLIKEAVALGASEEELNNCLESGKYTEKVKDMQTVGSEMFGITGTPGNVLINNETGEYEVISGAYPTSSFEAIIDKLLK